MRKLANVVDVDGEGIEQLLGEVITVFCTSLIYTGKLEGVNDKFIKLSGVKVVYETGPFNDPKWKDAQALPNDILVFFSQIESLGVVK